MANNQAGRQSHSAETFLPATFLERGASVPFTAPQLGGARVRRARDGKLECAMPSPGGRGVYVLPWHGVGSLCRPTAHDTRLIESISCMTVVTPHTIRTLCRAMTAEGFAGRAAMNAAKAATEAAANTRLRAHYWLLLKLIEDCEKRDGQVPPAKDSPANVQARARQLMPHLTARIGCSANAIADALDNLADQFGPLGVTPDMRDAYLPRLNVELGAMRDALRASPAGTDASQVDVTLIADVIDLLLTSAAAAARDALALTGRMGTLLQRWLADPKPLERVISQPEWLLDGWDRVHALWRLREDDKARGLPIREIAALLPLAPPGEPLAAGVHDALQKLLRDRHRSDLLAGDWQAATTALDHIARNEAALVHAA